MSLNEIIGLDLDQLDFSDQRSVKVLLSRLLNLLDALTKENVKLKQQIPKLKDEINRLKGEKGTPTFKLKKKKGQKQTKVDKKK